MDIEELTVEHLDLEFTASNGERVTAKVYLDRAIAALGLEPGDYATALAHLKAIARKASK
jgi:hypothetical protein